MGFKEAIEKAKRRGREPLGSGYGVHGAGGITETGGKSYIQISQKLIRQKKQDDAKAALTKIGKMGMAMGERMAKAQGIQEGKGSDRIQAPQMGNIENMGFGTPTKTKPKTKRQEPGIF